MEFIKPGTQIPFTSYRRITVILSTVINVAVLALLLIKGPNLGVDFAGGTMVHIKFAQDTSISEIRRALARSDLGRSVVQDFGGGGSGEFLIRLEAGTAQLVSLRAPLRSRSGDRPNPRRTDHYGSAYPGQL
jgi:preprotein translocase subunit SecF